MASKSYSLVLSLVLLTVFASACRPLWVNRYQACDGSCETKMDRNGNMNLYGNGNGVDSAKASAGMGMGIIPVPIPGIDGGYQFQMGPIGFVGNWSFGLLPPGSIVSYHQPIVVSPYSPPSSSTPARYMPLPQYYFPFPVEGSFGSHGSDPSRQNSEGSNQMQTPAPEHN